MTNKTLKTIIKNLANAPAIAAAQALKELHSPAERAEASRIFAALNIKTKEDGKQYEQLQN